MSKTLFYFFFMGFLFSTSNDCLKTFHSVNKNIFDSKYFYIKAFLNQNADDSLLIFIEKNKRYKINYNSKIIFGDKNKLFNFSYKTNQLFIEKPDSILNNFLFSFSDSLFLNKIIKNKYINFQDIDFFYNDNCNKIDSLIFHNLGNIIKLNDITIDTMNIIYPDSFFNLNIDDNKVFKYDFR